MREQLGILIEFPPPVSFMKQKIQKTILSSVFNHYLNWARLLIPNWFNKVYSTVFDYLFLDNIKLKLILSHMTALDVYQIKNKIKILEIFFLVLEKKDYNVKI